MAGRRSELSGSAGGTRRWPGAPGWWVRPLGFAVGVLVAGGAIGVALIGASILTRPLAATPASWTRPVVTNDGLVERVGVRIVQVAVTGGGGLLDLRVQVVDPDKASALHDPATPPAIVDGATNVVANQLLMGHAHGDAFKAGVTYYFVFENPGNLIQRGGRVSVLLGSAELDNVAVE